MVGPSFSSTRWAQASSEQARAWYVRPYPHINPLEGLSQKTEGTEDVKTLTAGLLQREDSGVSAPYDAITAEMRLD